MDMAKYNIEKFTGNNDFALWKMKMRASLVKQGLEEALEGENKLPADLTDKEKKEMMRKAYSDIILCLGDKVLREVTKEKTAAELWLKLESLYMTKTLASRLYLKQRLYGFQQGPGVSISDHIDEYHKIILDLENIGFKVEDEDQALLLIKSLNHSYDAFKDTLLYGRESISLEEVQSALMSKELNKKMDSKGNGQSEALIARGRSDKRDAKGKSRYRSKSRSKHNRCYICDKEGHFRNNCPEKRNGKGHKNEYEGSASYASDEYNDCEVLVAANCEEGEFHATIETREEESWALDSACSYNMCSRREWFVEYKELSTGRVLMGNNKACNILGIGTVKLKLEDGTIKLLTEVRHVPELKRPLISLGTLEDAGYTFKGENGILKVMKGSRVVMKGQRKNNKLYILLGSTVTGEVHATSTEFDKTLMWHHRLGHMSERGLQEMAKQDLLCGDKIKQMGFCEHCVMGKQTRVKFATGVHKTKEKLGYIHSDLWGPAQTPTHGGRRYFLTFTDDYSRKVWIYLLKTKDEAFKYFVEWKTMVEKQTGLKVKSLRTDNGLEFCNDQFNSYCKDNGIYRNLTVRGTPQQNGVAERLNRTLLEKVRCMLSCAKLPKTFWGEAVVTACYLVNRSPSTALNFKTPQEMWTGQGPKLHHLRVFGCPAYCHVKEGKLEPRSKKGIFMGYPSGVKGYRVWLPDERKSIISRDVVFQESKFLEDRTSNETLADSQVDKDCQIEVEFESTQKSKDNTVTPVEEPQQEMPSSSDDEEEVEDDPEIQPGKEYMLARDRERRQIRKPVRFVEEAETAYALNTAMEYVNEEPVSFRQATSCTDKQQWLVAMEEEMNSLHTNETWELVRKPTGVKLVGCKWIYKRKEGAAEKDPPRYKARLVAKGYTQREGIDYSEIFSPVVKHSSIRVLLSLVVHYGMELEQMDVKTAFLHGILEEKIYMSQPEGFEEKGKEDQVCLLKKSLYGLKQSPRQWYKRFDTYMLKIHFKRSNHDNCVYYRQINEDEYVYLLLYVDDMLIASRNKAEVVKLKKILSKEFDMKDLGRASKILGMEIEREGNSQSLRITQSGYARKIVEKFSMSNAKPASVPLAAQFKLSKEECPTTEKEMTQMEEIPYASAVGSLMYAMVCTRPDLAYSLSLVSRYLSNPGQMHWSAVKHIIRYLKGSINSGLQYSQGNAEQGGVTGYVDSDFAGDRDKRRSLTGYAFTLFGNTVSWKATLQHVVALSTTEAEYIGVTEAVKEALWLKGLVNELGVKQDSVEVFCDNQSAIHLCKNHAYHERTKHIDTRLHWIKDVIGQGVVKVQKVHTSNNPADFITKVVPLSKFRHCMNLLGIG